MVDYSKLPKRLRSKDESAQEAGYAARLEKLQEEIDALAPNLRALDKLEGAESRLRQAMESFERQRLDAKKSRDDFALVKSRRYNLFAPCFKAVSERIDTIYKELTGGEGTAYLSLEDSEEPYLEGIRYHAMPPGKRFLDMEQLSGGEKTIAALALLFALHSYRPAPFFILDEIDAALDNANVQRIAHYIRRQSSVCQFLVISLKAAFYEQSDALVGIYRAPASSRPLTLRLTDYDQQQQGRQHDATTFAVGKGVGREDAYDENAIGQNIIA